MTTANEIIEAALQNVGALDPAGTVTGAEATKLVSRFNRMVSNWYASSIMVYANVKSNQSLTIADNDYSIGSGGDFNQTRPEALLQAWILSGTQRYNVKVIGEREFYKIFAPATTGRPEVCWYNPDNPLGVINLYPTPDAAYDFHFIAKTALDDLTAYTDTIDFPPPYARALEWNFALEIWTPYNQDTPVPQLIILNAMNSLQPIIAQNAANRVEPVRLHIPGSTETPFDIMAGD